VINMVEIRSFALAAAAIVAASMVLAPTASATPPRDTDGTVLWRMTDDGKDYTFREISIAPAAAPAGIRMTASC
jgi:hypothetical protein